VRVVCKSLEIIRKLGLGELLKRYECDNDERRFSDEIVESQIDYDSAGAFLVGIDLGAMCSESERAVVEKSIVEINDNASQAYRFLMRARIDFLDDDQDSREEQLIRLRSTAGWIVRVHGGPR
jgi:hypothetical protein